MRGVGCSTSLAPSHPNLRVVRRWGVPKPRKLGRISGVSPEMKLEGFTNDIDTLERAVKERVFFVKENGRFVEPPKPAQGAFKTIMRDAEQELAAHLPVVAPLTREQFVDTFRAKKREVYARALDSLYHQSLTPRDANVKVFVKFEKTDFTRKSDPVPRVISPRDPRFNVEIGKFLRPLEERIFTSLGHCFGGARTVFKGMNSAESGRSMRGLWNEFRNPVALGLDASRFDQHVSLQALQWEHEVYKKCVPRVYRKELEELLKMQEVNHCSGWTPNGSLKYKKEGGRMSGDMNTSLGNCILMCCMIWQYSKVRGVKTRLANNGDDCVVFMEASDLAKFSAGLDEWFRALGFNMTVEEPCHIFEQIEFCQTHPVFVGPKADDYLMIRHPKWAIAKDTMSTHGWQSTRQFLGWMDAVGQGGLAMNGGIPVFQAFYSLLVRSGKPGGFEGASQSWGVKRLQLGMNRESMPILEDTRASFYFAFGITPDAQRVMEAFYEDMEIGTKAGTLEFQPPMPYDC